MTLRIDSLCRAQSDSAGYPGLAIAVARGKRIVYKKGYGYADVENQVPVDPDQHLFRIGSISKTITASALARLVARQRIDLDTPISRYLTGVPADKDSLTLRQVAGHLAGIRHYHGAEFMSSIHYPDVIAPLEVFMHDSLLCSPGSKYNYSTYGYTLVSAVMQEALHEPFLRILDDEVIRPLHLTDLRADQVDSTRYDRPVYYGKRFGVFVPEPPVDNSNKWAGGGLLCTADDLARYGLAHVRGHYIPRRTLKEFTTSQQTQDGTPTNYGIGFAVGKDKAGRPWFGHAGGSVGGTSMLLMYPDEDLVVVTLVNLSAAKMNDLAWRIADIVRSSTR